MKRLRVVLVLVSAIVLSGCAGNVEGVELVEAGGRILAVAAGGGAGGDASIAGTLALSDKSCWGVEQTDGSFVLVIWPTGTALDEEHIRSSAGVLGLGEDVRLSGGEATSSELQAIREKCNEDSAFSAWQLERQ